MVTAGPSEILVWEIPEDYPTAEIGEIVPNTGTDRMEFRKGVSLGKVPSPQVQFASLHQEKRDYYANNGALLLISSKLLRALEAFCPDDFETLPADVIVAGTPVAGIHLVNIVSTVDAIDHEQSEYEKFSGTDRIRRFLTLKFKSGALGVHHLSRASDYKGFVLVSRSLALYLKEAGIRGVSFSDPAEMVL